MCSEKKDSGIIKGFNDINLCLLRPGLALGGDPTNPSILRDTEKKKGSINLYEEGCLPSGWDSLLCECSGSPAGSRHRFYSFLGTNPGWRRHPCMRHRPHRCVWLKTAVFLDHEANLSTWRPPLVFRSVGGIGGGEEGRGWVGKYSKVQKAID